MRYAGVRVIRPRDVLEHYVRRHNQGVRSGDFSALLEMFTDEARGEEERALARRPPKDEIVVVSSREIGDSAIEAEIARGKASAKLTIEIDGGSIKRLTLA